jgi:hypothetical protein
VLKKILKNIRTLFCNIPTWSFRPETMVIMSVVMMVFPLIEVSVVFLNKLINIFMA